MLYDFVIAHKSLRYILYYYSISSFSLQKIFYLLVVRLQCKKRRKYLKIVNRVGVHKCLLKSMKVWQIL